MAGRWARMYPTLTETHSLSLEMPFLPSQELSRSLSGFHLNSTVLRIWQQTWKDWFDFTSDFLSPSLYIWQEHYSSVNQKKIRVHSQSKMCYSSGSYCWIYVCVEFVFAFMYWKHRNSLDTLKIWFKVVGLWSRKLFEGVWENVISVHPSHFSFLMPHFVLSN